MWRVPFNLIVRFDKSSRRKSQLPWCMKMGFRFSDSKSLCYVPLKLWILVLAFRDIAPQAPTHVLIIPKSKDGLSILHMQFDLLPVVAIFSALLNLVFWSMSGSLGTRFEAKLCACLGKHGYQLHQPGYV
ncbi:uncharacterized protein [Gossypium hirsutum]|uniref:Uncharacterized protein isoform X4 n=1 Tax=Gossypium hirsutum TaxID=3635 RepID=A0ABM2Z0S8_GOSHI|nr:uncharacterized protein LOC107923850 isoform X4 [Gossypium hirsutum]